MPKFSAESIEPLDYDFRGFRDESGAVIDDHGVIPEPSRARVTRMMDNVQNAFKELGVSKDVKTPEDIAAALEAAEKESGGDGGDDNMLFEKMNEKLFEAIADLCNGKPSTETLNRLGYRPFMAFFGWLMGEVMDPEASTPVTKKSRGQLKSV